MRQEKQLRNSDCQQFHMCRAKNSTNEFVHVGRYQIRQIAQSDPTDDLVG